MFIPRHPVVENQFCSYTAQTSDATGVGGVICYAGAVVFLQLTATNEEPIVEAFSIDETTKGSAYPDPFGFSMQKVKTGYHQVHPTGFTMPGDLGSSDVVAQPSYSSGSINGTKAAPLGVAHLGIWDTVHYTCDHSSTVVTDGDQHRPGDALFVAANCGAKVTNSTTTAADATVDGQRIDGDQVGVVVKGASAAKCTANIANTTLYPIRIKLLV